MEPKSGSTRHSFLLTLAVALSSAVLFLFIFATNPLEGMRAFFLGPFSSSFSLANLLGKTSLLLLTGLGASLAFHGGSFNLGGEGQVYLGALVFALTALFLPELPLGPWLPLLAAALTGFLLAGISGLMKTFGGLDELITTFLISRAVFPIADVLISSGTLKDPQSYLIASRQVSQSFQFSEIIAATGLNTSIYWILFLLLIFVFFLFFTLPGYRLRLTGMNSQFARYGGIRTNLYIILSIGISGAIHSMAGGILVAGVHGRIIQDISAGIGWNGIAVALIARKNPLALPFAALLLSYLETGARTATIYSDFPLELGFLLQGMVLLFITVREFPHLGRRKKSVL